MWRGGSGKTISHRGARVCACVCALLSDTHGEGVFNLDKDRPRSLSPAPGGSMAEQGGVRVHTEGATNSHQPVSGLQRRLL